jgi:1-deoxy-D-xylulose-5-phosphate synthase
MYTAQLEKNAKPFSIRYPRGNGVLVDWKRPLREIKIGKGRKLKDGEDIALLSIGHPGNSALMAAAELEKNGASVAVYDMRFVKPLDETLLKEVFGKFSKVITVEDGCIQGGFGSAVLEFMADNGFRAEVKRLGIPDAFIEHGEPHELWAECGYDTASIIKAATKMLSAVSVK